MVRKHSSTPALGGKGGGVEGDDISAGARPPTPHQRCPSGHSPLPRRPGGALGVWQDDGLQTDDGTGSLRRAADYPLGGRVKTGH